MCLCVVQGKSTVWHYLSEETQLWLAAAAASPWRQHQHRQRWYLLLNYFILHYRNENKTFDVSTSFRGLRQMKDFCWWRPLKEVETSKVLFLFWSCNLKLFSNIEFHPMSVFVESWYLCSTELSGLQRHSVTYGTFKCHLTMFCLNLLSCIHCTVTVFSLRVTCVYAFNRWSHCIWYWLLTSQLYLCNMLTNYYVQCILHISGHKSLHYLHQGGYILPGG